MHYVTYLRVSTEGQGNSGLGLEAQRKAVLDYINGNGSKVIAEYVEVESGRKADRPILAEAIAACKQHKAKLVIAKLDRLARNASFLLALRDSGIEFVCADMPDANRLTVGIMALVAEDEAERISARTKAALAAKKARGGVLGNAASLVRGRVNSRRTVASRTATHDVVVLEAIRSIQTAGLHSYEAIAGALNARGIATRRGGRFHANSVRRVMLRNKEEV